MRQLRLILLLIAISVAFAAALVWPVVGKADGDNPQPSIDPLPVPSTDVPQTISLITNPKVLTKKRATKARKLAAFHLPLGDRVVKYAKHFMGVRYVYGGSSPRYGFDCSGFVRYVYAHFGISLAHSSFSDYVTGRRVGRWQMKPGDLVFFDGAGHVGIYVGHGKFIHAPHTGTVVRISSMAGWYSARFDGARRIASR